MQRFIVAVVTSCAVVLSGCYVSTAPQTVLRGDAHHGSLIRAPWRGEYSLYRIPDHPRDAIDRAGEIIATVHLEKHQSLGFNPHGPAVAVANGKEFPLEDGRYEWVMKADPHQLDTVKSGILTGVIVIGVYVVAGIIIIAVIVIASHLQ